MKLFRTITLAAFCLCTSLCFPQKADGCKAVLRQYFADYTNPAFPNLGKITVENIVTDARLKSMVIRLSENFGYMPITPLVVGDLYADMARILPVPLNAYRLTILAGNTPIEQLIPTHQLDRPDTARVYKREPHKGNPWVTPLSMPYTIKKGLQGRHLCVWQSHGRYFSHAKQEWIWQRPRLYCTSEDLLTQTFVVPYVIPMLQNAGAIVFTPRERDWQKNEVIIDNDRIVDGSRYVERTAKYEWQEGGYGFGLSQQTWLNGDNPFQKGTYRMVEATQNRHQTSEVVWVPEITQEGDYAVYVSYHTLPNSISDAEYTVTHGGVTTKFRVNQQMGGGTWVYLGTFHFAAGKSESNCVTLSNLSNYRGVVTADAVRFGGGMGNILRSCDNMSVPIGSGMPRCLEAARYSAQWYGFPDSIYSPRGNDDYSDDINTRARAENLLAMGSNYFTCDSGLCVPIELSLAIHSDAGFHRDNTLVGTLGVYTTGFDEGRTATGLSRLVSRDLADMVMTQVCKDMEHHLGFWTRRDMWDRNYGETREPRFPAMILEMFSHQNWADMRFAHDPYFKFLFSRAIYKGVVRFLSTVHGERDCVIQPLPVVAVSAEAIPDKGQITVRWTPQADATEPTATPTGYIVYIKTPGSDFNNGYYVRGDNTSFTIQADPGLLYSFRVAAVNDGGYSMMSDEVCAAIGAANAPSLLLVDAFQRLASPLPFDNESTGGFDFDRDPGVIDVKSPGFCGRQQGFDKNNYGKENATGFGISSDEYEGMILAGNTHDYSTRHATDILTKHPGYNISSCTPALLSELDLRPYRLADFIFGAQKDDGYSLTRRKAFTPQIQSAISQLILQGASVLISGAFVGSDMTTPDDAGFLANKLKYRFVTATPTDSICAVEGLGHSTTLWTRPNEQNYWVRSTDVIEGIGGAFNTMIYGSSGYAAAIAYPGNDYRVMAFGFPIDCITDAETRRNIMDIAVSYLLTTP